MGFQRSEINVEINKRSSKRVRIRKQWKKNSSVRPWKLEGKKDRIDD